MKPPTRRRTQPKKNYCGTTPSPSSLRFREFVKVYVPASCSHQLRVPPDFSKHWKSIPRKAVLRKTNGRSWTIGMIENPSGLFIRRGWREFVQDNALQFGDCLIFQYDMCSEFLVKIFGRNGCEKQARVIEGPVVVKMDMEKEEAETPPPRTRNKFKSLKGDQTPESAEGRIMPKHPHIVPNLSSCWLRKPHLPITLLKHNGIKLKSEMILKNKKGEKWTVAVRAKSGGHLFLSAGWPKFRKDNKLQLNQQCVMEFVIDDQNECGELRVIVT